MTSLKLLFLILAGILAQLAIAAAVALLRRRAKALQPDVISIPPQSPVAPGAWSGLRAFRVARREMEDAASSQCSFYLVPTDGVALPPYQPGQFLTFGLSIAADPGATPNAVTRCYSLSDAPDPAHYRVTIKRALAPSSQPGVPAGVASGYFHDQVQVGDVLQVRAPSGRFFLDASSDVPVVLIGGGIGITPMLSMLRWCLAHQPEREVHLVYGARNAREVAFAALLEGLAASAPHFHLHRVYSNPAPDAAPGAGSTHAGYIDINLLQRIVPHGRHQFYVCGPPAMMESLVPALARWGVPVADIHFESFGPASVQLPLAPDAPAPASAAGAGFAIRFERSGRQLAWDGKQSNLLDFAEAHGIAVDAGCRCGNCGSCATQIVSGEVHYEHAPDFALAPGQCLLCVGKPGSNLVLGA